ncbi:MAG: hypothetical protein L0219_04995 [Phycisphaerales bacterium]|nr:hypothetical protein [Phycisphaerales bacterium]
MNTASKSVARRILPSLLCGLGLVTSGAVKADDVNNAVNVNPLIFADGVFHDLIRLVASTPAGVVTELVITHSFECAVEGNDKTTWFDINIIVDGVTVPPTNSDNASCTSTPPDNNLPSLDDWITTSQTVVRPVIGGNHLVIVRGRLVGFNIGERVRVDDQSLTVEEEDAT